MKARDLRPAIIITATVLASAAVVIYAGPDDPENMAAVKALQIHEERFPSIALQRLSSTYVPNDAGHRNVFTFVEAPPITHPVVVAHTAPPPITTPPVVTASAPPAPAAPQPPEFTMRCIGRFGPDHAPLAAFAGDHEVINARVGETIAEQFIVRAIGIESVEIGFVAFPNAPARRIAIGQTH